MIIMYKAMLTEKSMRQAYYYYTCPNKVTTLHYLQF